MLEIRNLHARIGDTPILKGVNLTVKPGEVHAIMGPNAAGKSTLSKVVAGHEDYEVTDGEVLLDGRSLRDVPAEERAREGLFLSFQYPVEIPGITTSYFVRTAMNAMRAARGEEELSAPAFLKLARERAKWVDLDPALLNRPVNVGFSGGEKKRNEIFQLAMLEPRFSFLDETDSGLDIDALRTVAAGVNRMRSPERGFVVITHYQRLLDYIRPDITHVFMDGRIVHSGGFDLVGVLERHGYGWIEEQVARGEPIAPPAEVG
jgi:Fe-S cluster assembly ATP-binding protein